MRLALVLFNRAPNRSSILLGTCVKLWNQLLKSPGRLSSDLVTCHQAFAIDAGIPHGSPYSWTLKRGQVGARRDFPRGARLHLAPLVTFAGLGPGRRAGRLFESLCRLWVLRKQRFDLR